MRFNHSPEIFVRVDIKLRVDGCTSVDNEIISDSINVELVSILTEGNDDFVVIYSGAKDSGASLAFCYGELPH